MTFGEKLYQLRKAYGLSQEALAEKLNTSRQAVSKWENNNGYPETEKMILLAKHFQISLDDLLMEEREIGVASDGADRNGESQSANNKNRDGYYVNRETANGFLLYYKKKFLLIAVACGLILGCNGFSYSSTEPDFFELAVEPILTTLSVMALLSVGVYIILKQNPYRNLRNKELVFSEEVKRELLEEFSKIKKSVAGRLCNLSCGNRHKRNVFLLETQFHMGYHVSFKRCRKFVGRDILHDICGCLRLCCGFLRGRVLVLCRITPKSA